MYYGVLAAVIVAAATFLLFRWRFRHKQRQLLTHVLAFTDTAIFTSTPDFVITSWNPAAERVLGYPASDIIGKSATVMIPAAGISDVMAIKRRLLAGDSLGIWEALRVHADGSEIPVSLTHTLFRDIFGRPSTIVTVLHDLRPATAAAAELQTLAHRLAGKGEQLDEAQQLAQVGSWERHVATGNGVWSAQMHRLFETDPLVFSPSLTNFLEYVHPDDRLTVVRAFGGTGRRHGNNVLVHRVITARGTLKTVEQRWRNYHDASGLHVSSFGTCQDISERYRAQESINELATRLSNTLESITDGFYVVDSERRFTYVNTAAAAHFEKSPDDLLGTLLWDALPPSALARSFCQHIELAATTMAPVYREMCNGKGEWFDVRIFPSAEGLGVHFRDVTDRHRAGVVLRAFARRIETVQEDERSSIAREIHDQVGQALTALRMDATRLQHRCAGDAETSAVIEEMTKVIDVTLQTTRSIAMALHPMVLEDLGLAAAIEMHVGHVAQRAQLKAALHLGETEPVVGRAPAAVAYRVLQESLTNVVRHAQASEICVSLEVTNGQLAMEVTDNGRGIDETEPDKSESLGLVGMRERAAALGGKVTIARVKPSGTRVLLHLPNVDAAQLAHAL